MTLNKHQGVRAGLAWNKDVAELIRQHNDANVLVLPGRFIDNKTASRILDEFFMAGFEGGSQRTPYACWMAIFLTRRLCALLDRNWSIWIRLRASNPQVPAQ